MLYVKRNSSAERFAKGEEDSPGPVNVEIVDYH
jgi:hypothetical protein